MSNTVSGATGPHYYQELYASPHKFDRLYLMNVRILTSEDGGKTFVQLKERDKKSKPEPEMKHPAYKVHTAKDLGYDNGPTKNPVLKDIF